MARRGEEPAGPARREESPRGRATRALDALLFASFGAAAVALALSLAASRALELEPRAAVLALAFAGTLFVYNVDRLRDLQGDRRTAPLRSAFVRRHGGTLALLAAVSAVAAAGFSLALGPAALALCGAVLALGLLHRRLKHLPALKTAYVTAAWLGITVGLPASTAPCYDGLAERIAWVAAVYALSVAPNLMVSNLRDAENLAGRAGARVVLRLAALLAAAGVAGALVGPESVRPLACVPGAELAALAWYRGSERYGLAAVDGALALGALAAFVISASR